MHSSGPDHELRPRRRVGQFELFTEIASGGMATVHLGRVIGAGDFARVVAIKRLHAHFAKDPIFTRMFLDEARVVARIRHPNVTPTIDLIEEEGELFIVMEYVEGETFAALLRESRRRKERVPVGVGVRIMTGALHGLHAAHEATNERGEPLNLVHRDVSPENVMVGTDGYPRLLDFGIARALGSFSQTREGEVKGKLAYMTPEQILGDPVTRRTDVFAASVVLWQALTGRQLFKGKHVGEYTHKILYKAIDPPSYVLPDLPKKYDTIVLKGLSREPEDRWPSALAMAEALEDASGMATQREVGVWVRRLASAQLAVLARKVTAVESAPHGATPVSIPPVGSVPPASEPDDSLAAARALVSRRAAAGQPRPWRRVRSSGPPSSEDAPTSAPPEVTAPAAEADASITPPPTMPAGVATPRPPGVPPPPPVRAGRPRRAGAPPSLPPRPVAGGGPSAPPLPRPAAVQGPNAPATTPSEEEQELAADAVKGPPFDHDEAYDDDDAVDEASAAAEQPPVVGGGPAVAAPETTADADEAASSSAAEAADGVDTDRANGAIGPPARSEDASRVAEWDSDEAPRRRPAAWLRESWRQRRTDTMIAGGAAALLVVLLLGWGLSDSSETAPGTSMGAGGQLTAPGSAAGGAAGSTEMAANTGGSLPVPDAAGTGGAGGPDTESLQDAGPDASGSASPPPKRPPRTSGTRPPPPKKPPSIYGRR